MSDGPTHFKNDTVHLLTKFLNVLHHFVFPYTTWSKGSVKPPERELFQVLAAITSELRIISKELTDLQPIAQSVVNNAQSLQLRNFLPIIPFTGLQPAASILTFM